MQTKILVRTPYFGDRPYPIEGLQPFIPYPIVNLLQGSFEFVLTVEGSPTPEEVNACAATIRAYVIANLVTAEIIPT